MAEKALQRAGVIVNKNLIPYDPEKPFVTSGIRIGTATVTSRGMTEDDMLRIAAWMDRVLRAPEDKDLHAAVAGEVAAFSRDFPIAQSYV